MLNRIFNPNHKYYHRIIIVGVIFAILFGIYELFIKPLFVENKIDDNILYKPRLVLVDTPVIKELRLKFPVPLYPKFIQIDSLKYYKKSEKRNIYDIIDSIQSNNNTPITKVLFTEIIFELKFINTGQSTAKNIKPIITDTLSFRPYLRNNIINSEFLENRSMVTDYIEVFDIKEQAPKDTQLIEFPKYIPQFFDKSRNIIFHLLVLYECPNGKLYDTYIWIKYNFVLKEFEIIYEPIYNINYNKNLLRYKCTVLHYIPKKPNKNEVLKYIAHTTDTQFMYKGSDAETIKNFIKSIDL